jgi:hypothetical protein
MIQTYVKTQRVMIQAVAEQSEVRGEYGLWQCGRTGGRGWSGCRKCNVVVLVS